MQLEVDGQLVLRDARTSRVPEILASLLLQLIVSPLAVLATEDGVADLFSEAWRWAEFDTDSGLPSEFVEDVIEVGPGEMWARSAYGIAWYDGFSWHRVPEIPGAIHISATPDGRVLVIGPRRRLWCGGRDGFTLVPTLHDGAPLTLSSVAAPTDDAVFLHAEEGLFRLDGPDVQPLGPPADGAPIRRIERTASGIRLYSGSGVFDWAEPGWRQRFHLETVFFSDLPEGGAVAAVRVKVGQGVWVRPPGAQEFQLIQQEYTWGIRAAAVSHEGRIVVAYESGAIRVGLGDRWGLLRPVPEPLVNQKFLRFQSDGTLWTGNDRGLFACRPFHRWSQRGPMDPNVNSILETASGELWVGHGAGVSIRDVNQRWHSLGEVDGQVLGPVTTLAKDSTGNVWVGSGARFAGAFRCRDGEWRHFGEKEGLGAPRVHRITPDRKGRLWFLSLPLSELVVETGPSTGAYILEDGRFTRWPHSDGLPGGRIYDFAEKADGSYWFATIGGVSSFHDGSWRHWTVDEGLRQPRVFTVEVGPRGHVWFGHQQLGCGAGRIDEDGRVRYFTESDGLCSNNIWEFATGPRGNLWIATNRGVSVWRNGEFSTLGREAGLTHPRIWPLLPQEEQVLVGTLTGGVYALHLQELTNPAPRVVLSDPEAMEGSASVRWHVNSRDGEIPASRILTRHRVDGSPWSPWSTDRLLHVDGLQPGEHEIAIQSKSLFGNLSEPVTVRVFLSGFFRRHPFITGFGALGIFVLALVGLAYGRNRRRNRELLQEREMQRARSQRMEALATLSGGIAHDFNNVLGVIVGYAHHLLSVRDDPERVERGLEQILKSARGASSLVTRILTFSRDRQAPLIPLPLDEVIAEAEKLVRATLPQNVDLETQLTPGWIRGDVAQIQQILLNLTSNAAYAMREAGGVIEIALHPIDLSTVWASAVGAPHAGPYLRLTVRDRGEGIDADAVNRIFDPFFTTKPIGEGTGLGLSMVHGIVASHGGACSVESGPGSGTTFELFFPREEPVPDTGPPSPQERPRRVLFVDDEEITSRLGKVALRELGYEVTAVTDSQRALEVFREGPDDFDIVVTDDRMPRLNGQELARSILAIRPGIPIVLTTGHAGPDPDEQRQLGIAELVRKPYRFADLAGVISLHVVSATAATECP